MLAWQRRTLINVIIAMYPIIPWHTCALVSINTILARCQIEAGIRLALVQVDLARGSGVANDALARVTVYTI